MPALVAAFTSACAALSTNLIVPTILVSVGVSIVYFASMRGWGIVKRMFGR